MTDLVNSFARLIEPFSTREPGAWDELEASGFLDLLTPESSGGAGLMLEDAFPLALCVGRRLTPAPIIETLIARNLVKDCPVGPILFRSDPNLDTGLIEGASVLIQVDDGFAVEAPDTTPNRRSEPGPQLLALSAALLSAQLAGAIQAVLDLTLDYAQLRQQFGRPIGKFQAVQQQLAVMAEEALSATMAARTAFRGDPGALDADRAAVAKFRASQAAQTVGTMSHAIHGAIGMSEEYALHKYTAQLRAWAFASGGGDYWARRLGHTALNSSDSFMDMAINLAPHALLDS
jgi:acyl-CoA dehydrogenase